MNAPILPVCSIRGCGAYAKPGDLPGRCVVHAQGFVKFDGSRDLHCCVCAKEFKKGEWVKQTALGHQHAGPCRGRKPK